MSYYPSPYGEPMYMPHSGYAAYSPYDTGYPVPVGYDHGYYGGSSYYPRSYYGHRHHRHHHYPRYATPRVYYKHRTMGDRFMGLLGMPQAHLHRL